MTMITLNDYLYSGDTVLRILKKYNEDLREERCSRWGISFSGLVGEATEYIV